MTNFDKVIPPGSEGKVTASVDLAHAKGPIEKNVEITTNDPDHPTMKLFLKANVKTYVDVQPTDMVRFTVEKGQEQTQELTLTPTYDKPVKLHDATVDSEVYEVKLTPADAQETKYKLNITIKKTAPIGMQRATISIPADGIPTKVLPLQVMAVVRGAIAAMPQNVTFAIHTYPDEVTSTAAVSVRQQANPTGAVVTQLPAGSPVKVIAQQNDWYQVLIPENKIGWVNKTVVKPTRPAEGAAPQTVTLQKTKGTFKILDISMPNPNVKVERMPDNGDGKSYSLKVTVQESQGLPQNGGIGSITVKTDDPDQPEVQIPVYVLIT